jgi:O-antigen ligase
VSRRVSAGTGLSKTSGGALVAAVAVPFIFLHISFQPSVSVTVGGSSAHAYLSDFAVLAVVVTAVVAGVRDGWRPLAPALTVWIAAAAFLAWLVVSLAWGRHVSPGYPLSKHAITAAKYIEYALLAPAIALLVRTRRDVVVLLWAIAVWSAAASVVGVAQFFGASIFSAANPGSRQGSFLSISDFAALSAAALLIALAAIALPRLGLGRALITVAAVAGVLGVTVAAAVASILGIATAVVVLLAVGFVRGGRLTWQRTLGLAALVGVVGVGVPAYRGGDLESFARFVGATNESSATQKTVQTYSHHTLLVWIGLQIWKDHPVLGAGWQASEDPATFEPHLRAAHRRFPTEPPLAFPSPTRLYGVQNAWVQTLSDLGVVGFALLVAMFGAVIRCAWRAMRAVTDPAAPIGLAWTVLAGWLLAAQGLVAGIPLDAVMWLAFGLVAVGAVRAADLEVVSQ